MNVLVLKEKSLILSLVSQRLAKKLILALVLVIVFEFFLFPAPVLASEYATENINIENSTTLVHNNVDLSVENKFINNLPGTNELTIVKESYHTLSAYNSDVAQCDATPCITANGFNLCEHKIEDSIAANFLKFGTKVRIPELFGDRVFIVRDRMNSRYTDRIDIWMVNKNDAKQFGIKIAKIEVLGAP